MTAPTTPAFVIFGATGNMGGHAARALLERGEPVHAVTRNPTGEAARALERQGATIVQADLDDPASLGRAVAGARGVFSVQNWISHGVETEIAQGCRLADACGAADVPHVVYGSAGEGKPNTGVAHFDAKLEVEARLRSLGVPHTIIRPAPFMELMIDSQFYPAVGVWGGERKIVGLERAIPWVAAADIGTAVANAFADPQRWIGEDVGLYGDVRSLGEARALYREALGRNPRSIPLPIWLIARLAGRDFVDMWEWMVPWLDAEGREGLLAQVERARELVPALTRMDAWFRARPSARAA